MTSPHTSDSWRPFPVECLPATVANYITAAARSIGCDPAFIAVPMLSCLAAAIGNTRRLRLKPGWDVPSVLWTATIAPSGSAKSPGLDAALRPVERYERDSRQQQPDDPLRCVVSDATIEALVCILSSNPRGLLLAVDELAGWFGSFDRYSGRGGGDVARWLSIYGARALRVDRKTGDVRHVFVPHAAVSITGTIQPGVLRDIIGESHRENGLLARLLLTMPPVHPRRWSDSGIDSAIQDSIDDLFRGLFALDFALDRDGQPFPATIDLDADARRLFTRWFNQHNQALTVLPEGDLRAAFAKLEEVPARLALVLHLARAAAGEPVDETLIGGETMSSAIELGRWFCHETRRVYAMLAESAADRSRRELIDLIERRGGRITVRELHRARNLRTADAAEGLLADLVRNGFGQWEFVPASPRGGPPSRVFALTVDQTSRPYDS